MKKTSNVLIRVDEVEKVGFERAAEISGLGLSSWARQVLRSAAVKQLHDIGEKAKFLEPVQVKTEGKDKK